MTEGIFLCLYVSWLLHHFLSTYDVDACREIVEAGTQILALDVVDAVVYGLASGLNSIDAGAYAICHDAHLIEEHTLGRGEGNLAGTGAGNVDAVLGPFLILHGEGSYLGAVVSHLERGAVTTVRRSLEGELGLAVEGKGRCGGRAALLGGAKLAALEATSTGD